MLLDKKTIVVKIGTEALSKADGTVDERLLGGIVKELVELKQEGHNVILVTSGAVGTGRTILSDEDFPADCDEVTKKQILASVGQVDLMAIYQNLIAATGYIDMSVSQVLSEKMHFRKPEHLKRMLLVAAGMKSILPIVNENDSAAIRELMFTDNDELAKDIAVLLKADHLIILTKTDGVYTSDPEKDPSAKKISCINAALFDEYGIDTCGKTNGGRGGMESKTNSCKEASYAGVIAHIVSSKTTGVVSAIVKGICDSGTMIYWPGTTRSMRRNKFICSRFLRGLDA